MTTTDIELPGLDCGICGYRTCEEFGRNWPHRRSRFGVAFIFRKMSPVPHQPDARARAGLRSLLLRAGVDPIVAAAHKCARPAAAAAIPTAPASGRSRQEQLPRKDSLGRDFDFYLEHFPEEPGPREIILPHNPLITREMEVQVGDILIGRPLGMSCGCPSRIAAWRRRSIRAPA